MNDRGSRSHTQSLVLIVATALGIYLCYGMALPAIFLGQRLILESA